MTCGITLNDEDYWFQNIWFSGFVNELKMASIELFNDNDIKKTAIMDLFEGHWPGRVYDLDSDSTDGVSMNELRLVFLRAMKYEQSCQSGPGPYDKDINKLIAELSKLTSRS